MIDTAEQTFLDLAIEQARIGWEEGGIPIGAALVHEGEVLAVGRNRRIQMGSAIRHGETDCLENAGRLPARVYRASTLYTTLSPCFMCAGTRCSTTSRASSSVRTAPSRPRSRGWPRAGVEIVVADDAPVQGAHGHDDRREARAVGRGHRGGGMSTTHVPHDRGHRPGLPGHAGAPARPQVVHLARDRAARLHRLHPDDAGGRRARARPSRSPTSSGSSCSARWCSASTSRCWAGSAPGRASPPSSCPATCWAGTGCKLASILLGGTQIGWYGVVIGTIGDLTAQALDWESYAGAGGRHGRWRAS